MPEQTTHPSRAELIATTEFGDRQTMATYRVDASTVPKAIELVEGDRTTLGIYELRGDNLRLCLSEARNDARPTAFESKPDSVNDLLIVLKRVDEMVASQIRTLEQALKLYRLDTLSYPSTEDELDALLRKPSDENQALNWMGPYRQGTGLGLTEAAAVLRNYQAGKQSGIVES